MLTLGPMCPIRLSRTCFLLFAIVAGSATACGAPRDNAVSSDAAFTANPEYDAVIARGAPRVVNDDTQSAQQSASTRVVGFVADSDPDDVVAKLLDVSRWTEIEDGEGEPAFERAVVLSESTDGSLRATNAELTMTGGVKLEIRAVVQETADGHRVRIANTTAYKHWFAGTILEPQKLSIDVKLVRYREGTIVDATARAKLRRLESQAGELTGSLEHIFRWLASD